MGREAKGLSKGRYDETFAGEDVMTMASKVFKKSSFQKKNHLNALGCKFDLDVK